VDDAWAVPQRPHTRCPRGRRGRAEVEGTVDASCTALKSKQLDIQYNQRNTSSLVLQGSPAGVTEPPSANNVDTPSPPPPHTAASRRGPVFHITRYCRVSPTRIHPQTHSSTDCATAELQAPPVYLPAHGLSSDYQCAGSTRCSTGVGLGGSLSPRWQGSSRGRPPRGGWRPCRRRSTRRAQPPASAVAAAAVTRARSPPWLPAAATAERQR